MFHRSGDAHVGTHGNSALWTPEAGSHRIALVLYLTELKNMDTSLSCDGTVEPSLSSGQG